MMKPAYDVVIIGSGFGGSIPAMRLARAQQAAGKTGVGLRAGDAASVTTAANFRATRPGRRNGSGAKKARAAGGA